MTKRIAALSAALLFLLSATASAAGPEWRDGEWTGRARGYRGPVTVRVTVREGRITEAKVVSHRDTPGSMKGAAAMLSREVVRRNGTRGVDAVAGATRSSRGFLRAVDRALERAAAGE